VIWQRAPAGAAPCVAVKKMKSVRGKVRNANEEAVAVLKQRFGDRVSAARAVREQHAHTTTWHPNEPPDAVVFAETTGEVVEIVGVCAERRVPVIAFGAGTSLEGHVNAPHGGICIDLTRMNRIIAVNQDDLDCVVEAGVTRVQLNTHLRDTGLFFPIDPGADASLGGMAATRASGTNAVRYGTMRDNVLNVTAVMPSGEVVRTGGRAKKSSAGYDLTGLLVGAEGTLGVITELTLKLRGIPEAISAGVCPFETLKGACEAVIATIQSGIPVARIELLDEVQVRACNAYSKLSLKETPTLFVEFHGSPAGVREQAESFGAIAGEYGGGPFDWATETEDRNRLWTARHNAYFAAIASAPGKKAFVSDVCVPISRLAECVLDTKRDIEDNRLQAPLVGHAGDGNFHASIMVDLEDLEERARAEAVLDRMVERALAMQGTCTGEHGVGEGKMKYLVQEHGEGVALMRAIKKAIDPDNIMNPGKIFAL
jgi:D-lactate dehydrogenase (cytochrome)